MPMMKVIVTAHAKKRLLEGRQKGITLEDIEREARKIPGSIPIATRFRGFISTNGQIYDIVAKDIQNGRLVITIIGKK
jgi:hypothetical protein